MTPIPSPALDPGIPPAVEKLLQLVGSGQLYDDLRSSISDALREATRTERERAIAVMAEVRRQNRSLEPTAHIQHLVDTLCNMFATRIRRSPTSDATNGR